MLALLIRSKPVERKELAGGWNRVIGGAGADVGNDDVDDAGNDDEDDDSKAAASYGLGTVMPNGNGPTETDDDGNDVDEGMESLLTASKRTDAAEEGADKEPTTLGSFDGAPGAEGGSRNSANASLLSADTPRRKACLSFSSSTRLSCSEYLSWSSVAARRWRISESDCS